MGGPTGCGISEEEGLLLWMNPGREVSGTPLGVEDETEVCGGVLVTGGGRPYVIGCVHVHIYTCVCVCVRVHVCMCIVRVWVENRIEE